ncbi:hypothetical protein [Alkalicoccus daliensis]|uniref:Uncharacterized protein n=1 Tax=Alkalicoccus daliensis TaxID=745820 RepID=A0A1H0CK87_9BACI|nr:hypothetical protein [Alkalicoccus daliensis]SDN58298.1 hypothetical protein SAMN04488053_102134 [Alkalicoccus daliensis]
MPVNELLCTDLIESTLETLTAWTEENKAALTGIAFAYGLENELETRLKMWLEHCLANKNKLPEDTEAYLWKTFLQECAIHDSIPNAGEREKLQVLDAEKKADLIAYSYGELSMNLAARISNKTEELLEEELIRSIRYIQACYN